MEVGNAPFNCVICFLFTMLNVYLQLILGKVHAKLLNFMMLWETRPLCLKVHKMWLALVFIARNWKQFSREEKKEKNGQSDEDLYSDEDSQLAVRIIVRKMRNKTAGTVGGSTSSLSYWISCFPQIHCCRSSSSDSWSEQCWQWQSYHHCAGECLLKYNPVSGCYVDPLHSEVDADWVPRGWSWNLFHEPFVHSGLAEALGKLVACFELFNWNTSLSFTTLRGAWIMGPVFSRAPNSVLVARCWPYGLARWVLHHNLESVGDVLEVLADGVVAYLGHSLVVFFSQDSCRPGFQSWCEPMALKNAANKLMHAFAAANKWQWLSHAMTLYYLCNSTTALAESPGAQHRVNSNLCSIMHASMPRYPFNLHQGRTWNLRPKTLQKLWRMEEIHLHRSQFPCTLLTWEKT